MFYVKDNKLVYHFNWYTYDRYTVTSTADVPTGKVSLRIDFKYDGGGPGKFGFDEQDVGMVLSSAVSEAYKPAFKFTGTIKKVTIDLKT